MTKQFEALLFDLGGTLIYFDGSWPEVMQAANRELLTHLQEQGLRLADRHRQRPDQGEGDGLEDERHHPVVGVDP